jgi:serine/threonine protein phosphatase 1
MRTLAIGDIHGCHTALITLLGAVKPTPADKIIFVGDYISRLADVFGRGFGQVLAGG